MPVPVCLSLCGMRSIHHGAISYLHRVCSAVARAAGPVCLQVAPFQDIWPRFPGGHPDSYFGAMFTSAISLVKPIFANNSRILQEMARTLGTGKRLSIKINVDGFVDDHTKWNFTYGRVTGAIGVQDADAPLRTVRSRVLRGVPNTALNTAYAVVHGGKVHVDLGNSWPTVGPGAALVDFANGTHLAPLRLALTDSSGAMHSVGDVFPAGPDDWYTTTAGIAVLDVPPGLEALVHTAPLQLMVLVPVEGAFVVTAVEAPDGVVVHADEFVFRFNPQPNAPDTARIPLYATKFGRRLPHANITFQLDESIMVGQRMHGPGVGLPNPATGRLPLAFGGDAVHVPDSANCSQSADQYKYCYTVTADANGTAFITVSASDPGNSRRYIDGQLFGVAYQVGTSPPPVGAIQNPSQILNFLVFDAYAAPAVPTWLGDVAPIFQQYANLYPVMRRVVDLSNYAGVVRDAAIIKNVFTVPVTSPNYMPVTRDLSTAKRAMILAWLDNPVYMDHGSVVQLKQALQTAIMLEHATIPVYMTAMWSIKDGWNMEVG
jgi:hypothetical protein